VNSFPPGAIGSAPIALLKKLKIETGRSTAKRAMRIDASATLNFIVLHDREQVYIMHMPILYHSTNNRNEKAGFRQALLNGIAPDYGLYMLDRRDIPRVKPADIKSMKTKSYAEIAHMILEPLVVPDIDGRDFGMLLEDAYDDKVIPVEIQPVTAKTRIMWLSRGPTYSFKDFAARFFARVLDYFLGKMGLRRVVIVATSGDTGGAVADALYGLGNVSNIVLFPRVAISEAQRRQMTTLGKNIFAFGVNGDFDVCQEIAKNLLGDRAFAGECFGDPERFTSANSISIGRLLPQSVYPFFAYSRMDASGTLSGRGHAGGGDHGLEPVIASIPSGNFGDMMGTVIAKQMGLPVEKIVCGVNENREFPEFLATRRYTVRRSEWSPSTAMIVSHPSNLARLIEFYGGHMEDERDGTTKKVTRSGVVKTMPDVDEMLRDLFSVSVSNEDHYRTIREVYETHGIILDPHGAVGWKSLMEYTGGRHDRPAVVYETADPGKFPEDIVKALGVSPEIPEGIRRQAALPERTFTVDCDPSVDAAGSKRMSEAQYGEIKEKVRELFREKGEDG
jgi:threonine synthase